MQRNYLLGCDPEFFVHDKKGRVVSAHGLVSGTKEHPFDVPGGAVQVDGTALEFNTTPAATRQEWIDSVSGVYGWLSEYVKDQGLSPSPLSCVTFEPAQWAKVPDENRMLGCDPDYNAWTGEVNEGRQPPKRFRTAAGHIHIGWGNGLDADSDKHMAECARMVRHLDNTLGVASVLLDGGAERRQLYGAAGAYRPKPYGVEYRVLSNFWIQSEAAMKWVWDTTLDALELYDKGDIRQNWAAVDIINSGSAEAAHQFLKKAG